MKIMSPVMKVRGSYPLRDFLVYPLSDVPLAMSKFPQRAALQLSWHFQPLETPAVVICFSKNNKLLVSFVSNLPLFVSAPLSERKGEGERADVCTAECKPPYTCSKVLPHRV